MQACFPESADGPLQLESAFFPCVHTHRHTHARTNTPRAGHEADVSETLDLQDTVMEAEIEK